MLGCDHRTCRYTVKRTPAKLELEDGSVFHGYAFGAVEPTSGEVIIYSSFFYLSTLHLEPFALSFRARSSMPLVLQVVFNTSMTSYPDSLTDPS